MKKQQNIEITILNEITNLINKWLNDRQKLINKCERAFTSERQIELLAKIEQCAKMHNELFDIYKKWLDYLNTDNK